MRLCRCEYKAKLGERSKSEATFRVNAFPIKRETRRYAVVLERRRKRKRREKKRERDVKEERDDFNEEDFVEI